MANFVPSSQTPASLLDNKTLTKTIFSMKKMEKEKTLTNG